MGKKKPLSIPPARPGAEEGDSDSAPTVLRSSDTPAHLAGRPTKGLYPEVSRKLMAERCGLHLTTITSVLSGRTRMSLEVANLLTKELGIGIDELLKDLAGAQQTYQAEKKKKKVAATRKKRKS